MFKTNVAVNEVFLPVKVDNFPQIGKRILWRHYCPDKLKWLFWSKSDDPEVDHVSAERAAESRADGTTDPGEIDMVKIFIRCEYFYMEYGWLLKRHNE